MADHGRDIELLLTPEIERRVNRMVDDRLEDVEKKVRKQIAKELGLVDARGDIALYDFKLFWQKHKAAEKRWSQAIGAVGIAMITAFCIWVVPWIGKAILAKINLGPPTP